MATPRTVFLVLLTLTTWLAADAAASERLGFVATRSGDVAIQPGGDGSFQAARVDRGIAPGDVLRTGAGASAKLVVGDGLMLIVSEETEIRFPAGPEERFRQTRGRARFVVLEGSRDEPGVRVAIGEDLFVHGWAVDFELWRNLEPQDGERPWRVCNQSGGLEIRGGFGVIEPKDDRCTDVGIASTPSDPYVPEDPPETPPTSTPGDDPRDDPDDLPGTPPVAAGPDDPRRPGGPPSLAEDMLDTPDSFGAEFDDLEPELPVEVDADLPGGGAGGGRTPGRP